MPAQRCARTASTSSRGTSTSTTSGRRSTSTRSMTCRAPTSTATSTASRRIAELEADGVVAEVLFPNTIPPFFPSGNLVAPQPSAEEYEQRWAGLKAHNRWMVDFCQEAPGRRAGIAQIMLNDVDDAVGEIRWAKDAGLTGGILLPGVAARRAGAAAALTRVRADLGGVRGARRRHQPPWRRRVAERAHRGPDRRRHLPHRARRGTRTGRCGT